MPELPDESVIKQLKSHYRSGVNNIGEDFFVPCMNLCSGYCRAAGYFSSSALVSWAKALPRLAVSDEINIKLIISPELSISDAEVLKKVTDEEEANKIRAELIDSIIKDSLSFIENPGEVSLRLKLFAWLIATNKLTLRFAFATHVEEPGIFHEKIGIFYFPWGERVAFTGSANETASGHKRNYESIDVYRSWVPSDAARVQTKEEQFNEAWDNLAEGLEVLSLKKETLAYIKAKAPSQKPQILPSKSFSFPVAASQPDKKWRHQEEAVAKFLQHGNGVLEMATGTGKTRTALKILNKLLGDSLIRSIVISTEGTDLLDQWASELTHWGLRQSPRLLILRHYGSEHEIGDFVLDPKNSVLVVSRGNLEHLCNRLENEGTDLSKIAIVHDEVHGLGSPSLKRTVSGKLSKFKYRLGLSATPEREYDQDGSNFIKDEVGDIIFQFSLEDAIERGILCEFDYVPLEYNLTKNDKERLAQVYSKKAAREKDGNPMAKEEIWTEISKVYKTAEMKPYVFAEYLKDNSKCIKNGIIFVETKEYGERLLELLHSYTHLYRTYYAEDEKQNLIDFSKGKIDCLLTCHKISQGIDIQKLENVILFSSARVKLETIQRIGRCLRIDPNNTQKKALIVDFVRPQEEESVFLNADQDRYEWLLELSKIKHKE